tara:strand:- start:129499 stop:130269 length:771 start_codon:yes stop_codon:yes gene_type:complete
MAVLEPLKQALWAARTDKRFIATADCPALPADEGQAYAVADWLHQQRGGDVAGWKLGATSSRAQVFLQLPGPFLGRIYSDQVLASPAQLPDEGGELALEAEFGLRLGRDIAADEVVDAAAMQAAMDAVVPLIEVNRPSYQEPFKVGALAIIADNGVNAGMVAGAPQAGISGAALAAARIRVSLNGAVAGEGSFADAADDVYAQLAWAADALRKRGIALRAGQVFATGSCAGTQVVTAGDQLTADFGPWGSLAVSVA